MQTEKSGTLANSTNESLQCQTDPALRILVVDDDSHRCRLNAEVLRRQNYEVKTAADGQAGWEELQTNHYHLLITENELPRLTGVGLVQKLQSASMPLPVIVVTTSLPARKSPEYSWLLKATKLFRPYRFDDLLGLVEKVLTETACALAETAPTTGQNQPQSYRI